MRPKSLTSDIIKLKKMAAEGNPNVLNYRDLGAKIIKDNVKLIAKGKTTSYSWYHANPDKRSESFDRANLDFEEKLRIFEQVDTESWVEGSVAECVDLMFAALNDLEQCAMCMDSEKSKFISEKRKVQKPNVAQQRAGLLFGKMFKRWAENGTASKRIVRFLVDVGALPPEF